MKNRFIVALALAFLMSSAYPAFPQDARKYAQQTLKMVESGKKRMAGLLLLKENKFEEARKEYEAALEIELTIDKKYVYDPEIINKEIIAISSDIGYCYRNCYDYENASKSYGKADAVLLHQSVTEDG